MKTWQKATFIIVLVVFIIASVTISFISLARAPFEYEYQTELGENANEEGWVMFGFNGNPQTANVRIDFVRDEDGNNPDKTKPVSAVGNFTMNTDEYVETIYIGKDVKYIDEKSFFYCKMLRSIEVDKDNPYYTSVDGVLFTKDMKTLVVYPYNKGGAHNEEIEATPAEAMTYTIPEGVERIAAAAFYKNDILTEVKLPSTLKEIGDMAFFKCEKISLVTLPDGLEKIGSDAFSYCHGMKPLIYIPASVKEIGNYAFYSCANLNAFYMGAKSEDEIIQGESWLPKNIEKTVINIAPEAQYGKTRADADEIIRTITTEEGGEN